MFSGQGEYSAVESPSKVTGDTAGEKIVQVSSKADTVLAVSGQTTVFLSTLSGS